MLCTGSMLQLPCPVTPASVPQLAEAGRNVAHSMGLRLDGTPDSLRNVDHLLDYLRKQGHTLDSASNLLICVGAYVGEVFRGHLGGRWVPGSQTVIGQDAPLALVFGNSIANPLGKCAKRLVNGQEDSVETFFYQMLSVSRGATPQAAGMASRDALPAKRPSWVPDRPVDTCGVAPIVTNLPIFLEYAQRIGSQMDLRLNGTPMTLVFADALLNRMPRDIPIDTANTIAFCLGCYAGSVFAQTTGAQWFLHGEHEGFPRPALWLHGRLMDPIAQILHWKTTGQEANLIGWYTSLTETRPN